MSAMGQKQTSRRHLANVRFASQSGHVRVASGSPAQKVYILHKKLSLSGALCAKPPTGSTCFALVEPRSRPHLTFTGLFSASCPNHSSCNCPRRVAHPASEKSEV